MRGIVPAWASQADVDEEGGSGESVRPKPGRHVRVKQQRAVAVIKSAKDMLGTTILLRHVGASEVADSIVGGQKVTNSGVVKLFIAQPPDWNLPFEIMCDACDYAVGAVLGQRVDKNLNVIHYACKTLDSAQRNYTITEKKIVAVVFACDKFRSYIVNSKVIVHNAHVVIK